MYERGRRVEMNSFTEGIIVIVFIVIGFSLVSVGLRFVYGKNLTFKWFIRLMRTFLLEKKDMNPQKGIDENSNIKRGKHVHEFSVPRIRSCRL